MSNSDGSSGNGNGNRTVFRPSPLSGLRQGQNPQPGAPAAPPPGAGFAPPPGFSSPPPPPPGFSPPPPPIGGAPGFGAPGYDAPPAGYVPPQPQAAQPAMLGASQRLHDEDIPMPSLARDTRSPLVMEASAVLALAASVRSGRARISMPEFHREASQAIAAYDRAITPLYSDEVRQRALYALCATVDDIAQNLPGIGQDGAEWARRSLVVMFFRENIGGDRFWQLVEELLKRPAQNAELIELYACCLAAGFEGRFRVMPDGKTRLQQILQSLYGALDHPRGLSMVELSPQWRGGDAPLGRISLWNKIALAAAAALAFLLLLYIVLRLLLMAAGGDAWKAVGDLTPDQALRMSRAGAPPPPAADSVQLGKLRRFLEPEIQQKLVVVEEDASTVRVRTTVGQLFKSGSDQLEPGRAELFERIGRAVEKEPGQVTIEGHADSDQVRSLAFPDNLALSKARAQTIATIIGATLSDQGRMIVKGFGESRPIASNKTAEGKSLNRRVEVVIPRQH